MSCLFPCPPCGDLLWLKGAQGLWLEGQMGSGNIHLAAFRDLQGSIFMPLQALGLGFDLLSKGRGGKETYASSRIYLLFSLPAATLCIAICGHGWVLATNTKVYVYLAECLAQFRGSTEKFWIAMYQGLIMEGRSWLRGPKKGPPTWSWSRKHPPNRKTKITLFTH